MYMYWSESAVSETEEDMGRQNPVPESEEMDSAHTNTINERLLSFLQWIFSQL
jgi:hypothetical protein